MRSHGPPRGGDHIEPGVTETPTNRNLGSYHRRRHRIAVAPHRHQAVRSDLTDQSALGRIRHCGKWEQRFGIGKFAHCALSSPAGVPHRLAESIEAVLRLGQGVHHSGAPPTLAQIMDRLLCDAFAVRTSWRAGVDPHPVVFGHPHERRLDTVGARKAPPSPSEHIRHRRAVPPRCRSTASMPSTR